MADPLPPQNFENHRRFDAVYLGAGLAILIAAIIALVAAIKHPSFGTLQMLLLTGGVVCVHIRLRGYALTLQNRIIQLETRLRLAALLKGEMEGKGEELTMRQLIGVRFASDAEMPDLVRKVLAEKIEKADNIKRLVKDWRADRMRV